MSVVARGLLSQPLSTLKSMLSDCTSYQKLVQVANAAAALPFIFIAGAPGETERPFAVVDFAEITRASNSGGARHYYKPSGKHKISFEFPLDWAADLTVVTDTTHITAAELIGLPDDFFNGLSVLSGESTVEITDFDGATGALTLGTALSQLPVVGDEIHIQPTTDADALIFFMNVIGDIMEELEGKSGTGGCVAIKSWMAFDCGRAQDDVSRDDFYGIVVVLEYGS